MRTIVVRCCPRLTKPLAETMKILAAVIRGRCNYYGVNVNFHSIQKFLGISETQHIPNAEQKRPKRKIQIRKVSESVKLLCIRTSFND